MLHEHGPRFGYPGLADDAQQDTADAIVSLRPKRRDQLWRVGCRIGLQLAADDVQPATRHVVTTEQLDALGDSGESRVLSLPARVDGIFHLTASLFVLILGLCPDGSETSLMLCSLISATAWGSRSDRVHGLRLIKRLMS